MLSVSSFLKNEYGINGIIFPEITYTNENDKENDNELSSIYLGMLAPMAYNIYICYIVGEVLREKKNGMKHLLYLSGVNMFSYWFSFFIFHFFKLLLLNSFFTLGIYFVSDAGIYIFSLLILSSFSSLFFIYSLIKYFEKEESIMNLYSYALILIFIFVYLISNIININLFGLFISPDYNILDIFPMFSQIKGCYSFTVSYYEGIAASNTRIIKTIIIQLINCIIYLVLMILTEKNIFRKGFNYIKVKYFINDSNIAFSNVQINEEFLNDNNLTKTEQTPLLQNNIQNEIENTINNNVDNGSKNAINSNLVAIERNRIIEDNNKNSIPTKIVGLKKTYWFCCKKNIRAVNNIYFGLEDNEKFGLLGFNGSGKTTTFKSITNEIFYDSGIINISNRNLNSQFNEIRKTIGYCPQENPILDYMKVREMIEFFLDLKEIPDTAENVCKRFGLEKYIDTYCENLSGGNKRKLSFALALIGHPRILLLDEPSTGVDPESRRIMWKNIINLNKNKVNFNMILTTHSMEEAELLTDRICWLKSGSIVTIGNPEKLKMLLSVGYNLHIKIAHSSSEKNNEKAKAMICSSIKGFERILDKNSYIYPYLGELLNLMILFSANCSNITLSNINKDISFDFNVKIIKERKKILFTKLINLKKENKNISQVDISKESLENILTQI